MPKRRRSKKFNTEYKNLASSSQPYDLNLSKNRRPGIAFYFGSAAKGYTLDKKRKPENSALVKNMSIWSTMTYEELIGAPKESHGNEFIDVKSLKKTLPQRYFSKDVSRVNVLRFNGTSCRLIGVYSESDNVFDVAFVDYSLEIYDH